MTLSGESVLTRMTEDVATLSAAGVNSSKICAVCHGTASGMYFGALVCLPCKSFFIRSTKDGEPTFTCVTNQGNCDVLLGNRLRCQFCRYQKCLDVGMCRKEKPEVVDAQEGQKLCDVCHDIANGVHFGVPTCEGCKKFFRRGMKEAETYECKLYKDCPINPRNRNVCRYCRYQRCLAVGMSKQAIQMGRPKKEAIQGKRLLPAGSKDSTNKVQIPEFSRHCVVCSDMSSGSHFGVLTCEECKVFFVYGGHEAVNFTCNNSGACTIDLINKSTCHFCWYQKCLSAGMKPVRVPKGAHNFPVNVKEIQTARHPKQYRSESAGSGLSDLDTGRFEPAVGYPPVVMFPHQGSVHDRQKSMVQDSTSHCHPLDDDGQNKMDLSEVLREVRSEFPAGFGKGESNAHAFSQWDGDKFIENLEKDTPDTLSSKVVGTMYDHSRALDKVQAHNMEGDVGYVNEMKLHVVNEFYDKTTGQKYQQGTSRSFKSNSTSDRTDSDDAGTSSESKTVSTASSESSSSASKEEGQQYTNSDTSDVTTAVFSSHMKYPHPESTQKMEDTFSNDTDINKKVTLEKQKAKLSLFSRYYWKRSFTLPCNVINSNHTILVIARIIKAYKVFLAETDEGQRQNKENLNQKKQWPKEKGHSFPYWEHIKNRIVNNTRSCVNFIRSSVTEVMPLNQDDAKVLYFYGCFQAMIILSTRERYNPEEKSFQYFWNWKVPQQSPAYLFRQNLLKAAEDLYQMNIDITESAVMCILSVISADWITLREPELVEKLRTPIVTAFKEYLSVKYGCDSKRGEELMSMMPVLRELTLWHSEMMANMKLSIKTEDIDGLFKSLCL